MPSLNSLRAVLAEDWQNGGFGLYIHWPFCQAKCPYCNFNSHVSVQIDQARWCKALLAELDRVGAETQGRVLNSIFFGGGGGNLVYGRGDCISEHPEFSGSRAISFTVNPPLKPGARNHIV